VVGVTKAVSERFGHGGIADRMIYLNGYPFLDNKEEHTFGVPVSQVMASHVVSLPATGLELRQLERIMNENQYQGYPIIEDSRSKILVGYIGRTELWYAIDRAKRDQMAPGHAKCYFTSSTTSTDTSRTPSSTAPSTTFDTIPTTSGSLTIDLSKFTDPTPLTVHPRLPLETVMELFKKMGPRVVLIEYRGRLTGLVTVKDCLKYQFKVEAHDHPQTVPGLDERQEKLWGVIRTAAGWVDSGLSNLRRRTGFGGGGQGVRLESPALTRGEERERFVVGDEDAEVELEDRGRGGDR
jgi:chloride channel 3/4/5